jgi:hypothetical protein
MSKTKRAPGRPSVKGLGAKNTTTITIRMTRDQERRLKQLAAKRGLGVADVVRSLVLMAEVAAGDPGGMGALLLTEGPYQVQREVVDQVQLEDAGQLRMRGC